MKTWIFTVVLLLNSAIAGCGKEEKKNDDEATAESKSEPQAAGTLALDLSGAAGLAVAGTAATLNLQETTDSLLKMDDSGKLSSAWSQGTAIVKQVAASPTGEMFLVFDGVQILPDDETAALALGDGTKQLPQCILGKMRASGEVRCLETRDSIGDVRSIKFADNGDAIYINGAGRLLKNKVDILDKEKHAQQYSVASNGDVYVTGESSGGRFLNEYSAGSSAPIMSNFVHWLSLMPDGVFLFYDTSFKKYTNGTVEEWISGDVNSTTAPHTIQDLCNNPVCNIELTVQNKTAATSQAFYFISGGDETGHVFQIYPTPGQVETTVKKATLLAASGDALLLAGQDASGFVLTKIENGKESTLLSGVEMYSMSVKDQELVFSGFRYKENAPCVGKINLVTGETVIENSTTKISTVLGL